MSEISPGDDSEGTPVTFGGGRRPTTVELWTQLKPVLLEARAVYGPFDVYGVLEEYVTGREPRQRTRAWQILGPRLDQLAEQYGRETIEPFVERVAERVRSDWD